MKQYYFILFLLNVYMYMVFETGDIFMEKRAEFNME